MIENKPMIRRHNSEMLEWVTGHQDLVDQCVAMGWMIEQRQEEIARLAQYRKTAMKQLRNEGRSMRGIAKELGMSASRVEQLLKPAWKPTQENE